jgi:uncharacterized membrane protein/protein-disulfide isomerase
MSFFHCKGKPIVPLPFPVYFWTVALLALAGLLNSIYLAISHYRVYTDIGYRSFCAISKAINCDTVSQSPYSIILNVPVPVWGIIGYTFFLLFLVFAWSKPRQCMRLWSLLTGIAMIFSCISIGLALILTIYIHSYCIMCMLSYGINFTLLFFTALTRKRFNTSGFFAGLRQDIFSLIQKRARVVAVFAPFLIIVCISIATFPGYWKIMPGRVSAEIPQGLTEDGHPWIGAESPELTIIEFSDYLCFQCKKMHYYLRRLVAENPTKIRLVHRHFPMDHEVNFIVEDPFHIGSGKMALAAIYSVSEGKFWEMNDLLFELAGNQKKMHLNELASKTSLDSRRLVGAIYSPEIRQKLKIDIWTALKFRMVGTPSYLIDGKVYQGQLPPEIFKQILG